MCFDQHLHQYTYIHVHLHSWLGLMTLEPKGKSSQGENFISMLIHSYDLNYNVLSGLIITSFSRSKRVNGKIICLCTRLEENLFACKISSPVYTATVIELRFFMKESLKSYLPVFHTSYDIFIQFFACSYLFTCSPP